MKVLLVHEYYRSTSPSGEDQVFENEKKLLANNGIRFRVLSFKNDMIGSVDGPSLLKTALYTPWSPTGRKQIQIAIDSFKPDVVHFHNTFPYISPAAIFQAKKMRVATVQTLHNFRTICANAILMDSKGVCEKCIGKYPWNAVLKRCYRKSLFATLPIAMNISLHRYLGTWQSQIDRFIALSEFNKRKFISAGFPEHKFYVKPNFIIDHADLNTIKDGTWIFIGRLSKEKGVHFIPKVWSCIGENSPILHVVGDGPYSDKLKTDLKKLNLTQKVILHGKCAPKHVQSLLGKSSLLFFPSICYEGFPMVIGEAFMQGIAIAASRIGTPAYIVKDGFTGIHFSPGDIGDIVAKLKKIIDNPNQLSRWGQNARKEYEKYYSPSYNLQRLIEIYVSAISENKKN